jgi:hypothetical protein
MKLHVFSRCNGIIFVILKQEYLLSASISFPQNLSYFKGKNSIIYTFPVSIINIIEANNYYNGIFNIS